MQVNDVHLVVPAVAHGVSPHDALAWWSDFREGVVHHGAGARTRRRILSRDADGAVVTEDVGVGFPFRERVRATVDRDALAVRFEGENALTRFRGAYRFEAHSAGTRAVLDVTLSPKLIVRPFRALVRPVARRLLAVDLRAHLDEMSRDLQRGSE